MLSFANPFSVETPEQMSAEDINSLFVPQAESLSLGGKGHVFLHGHRGCGKTMMFRRLAPDCQTLHHQLPVNELPFFGVYTSIKKTEIDIVDFSVLENSTSKIIIAEHVMVCYFLSRLFAEIRKHCVIESQDEVEDYIKKEFYYILEDAGLEDTIDLSKIDSRFSENKLDFLVHFFDRNYNQYVRFLKRSLIHGLEKNQVQFESPLFSFYEAFLPIVESVQKLSFMPESPIFFLIDDADNLNIEQTKILNTWVSYRTTDFLSFKISTQMNYKTYDTQSGRRIETPHDYKELTYSKVQTGSKKERYADWVYEVTQKRLELFSKLNPNIRTDPREFFEKDIQQENAIDEIALKYKTGNVKGGSSRPSDNAYRYARPDYIKSLGGMQKNRNKYKYAGFDQLVHVSSGVIRYFLDAASKMYAQTARDDSDIKVDFIPPSIQNKVLRDESDILLFQHVDKIANDDNNNIEFRRIKKLRHLIHSIGSIFYAALISERSERKFFSFVISDSENMSDELNQVIRLGIQEGLLFESYVGTKEGFGRTKLYVMTRRLAPYFNLDPMGFSGYKSLQSHFLHNAINEPKSFINGLKNQGIEYLDKNSESSLDGTNEPVQGTLL
ncbi:hypothetical protein [Vibrio vulnificus]|uniref:FunZ protein n=1 Tax=Vibrio vulnificus TaxID=672 RepID=A0AAW4HGH9_VIBVL|nr:hypothetical protein [Vibrio vulnificus]ELV8766805.1 hypothetical protein [Vibrio vulnificus]MBN8123461.1 hypothetical protein [Vibrio vulnificus]HDY8145228.1 hypothetical protein [Vibrio vulnificus]